MRWHLSLPVREEAACDDSSARRELQSSRAFIGRSAQAALRASELGAEESPAGGACAMVLTSGTCSNRARGYQSSLSFVPGGRPGGSPDWSDSASVSDGASTYERAVRHPLYAAQVSANTRAGRLTWRRRRAAFRRLACDDSGAAPDGIRESSVWPAPPRRLTLFGVADAARRVFRACSSCSHLVDVDRMGCACYSHAFGPVFR